MVAADPIMNRQWLQAAAPVGRRPPIGSSIVSVAAPSATREVQRRRQASCRRPAWLLVADAGLKVKVRVGVRVKVRVGVRVKVKVGVKIGVRVKVRI